MHVAIYLFQTFAFWSDEYNIITKFKRNTIGLWNFSVKAEIKKQSDWLQFI